VLIRVILCLSLFWLSYGLADTETCVPDIPEPQTEEEREEYAIREAYRAKLASYVAQLPAEPDSQLLMPVEGVRLSGIADTWGAPRGGGRSHEGQDIFAAAGTPIYSATNGIVYRIGTSNLGGNIVFIVGAGNRRYYYAHLQDWADIQEGQSVTTDTVIGFVGNTGNARTTPPHLHFGIYSGSRRTCDRMVYDPLPLLVNR
jgi:murein DD-endopeptidase MepM/ murein hydrolase activator NlpD